MAKAYSTTPYDLVSDSYAALDFNRAIYLFGSRVDNLLEQKDEVKQGDKIVYKPRYTVEEAIERASEDPKKPKLEGFAAMFAAMG